MSGDPPTILTHLPPNSTDDRQLSQCASFPFSVRIRIFFLPIHTLPHRAPHLHNPPPNFPHYIFPPLRPHIRSSLKPVSHRSREGRGTVSGGVGLCLPAGTMIIIIVAVFLTECKFCEYTLQFRSPQHWVDDPSVLGGGSYWHTVSALVRRL